MMWERSQEEHNGHTNYETWAFYTHVTQTESLLNRALAVTRPLVEQDYHPAVIGDQVVRHFREWATNIVHYRTESYDPIVFPEWRDASLMLQDVGSWWRIDDSSIGRHMVDYVKESVS